MGSLSSLPDEILHYILSLSKLTMFDLVKFSVLSKRWNHLFNTMPYLSFNLFRFYDWNDNAVQDLELLERLRSFINWVLISREDLPIAKFLLCSSDSYDTVQVLRWLRAVAKRNVKELYIGFCPSGVFKLPLFIAASESLEVLKLNLCGSVMQLPNYIKLNRLRQLDLTHIEFTDSDLLQTLVSGCCVLDTLNIDSCLAKKVTYLHISSTSIKLMHINFCEDADIGNCEIKVSCPSLTQFRYMVPVPKSRILLNAPIIESAEIELMDYTDVLEIPNVRLVMYEILENVCSVTTLSLCDKVVPCLYYAIDEMLRYPITFHKVKFLTLDLSIAGIHTQVTFLLVDHCPNLEVPSLICTEWIDPEWDERWQLDHEGIVSWKSHPHLKTIELSNFKGNGYDLDFLKFLLKNASTLEKLNILCEMEETCPSIIKIVSDFPRASLNCKVKFSSRIGWTGDRC